VEHAKGCRCRCKVLCSRQPGHHSDSALQPCRYERYWAAAIAAGADLVSITSFNEWGEGTQIEPASARCDSLTGGVYEDYGARGPGMYLKLTQFWSQVWRATLQRRLFPLLDGEQRAAAQLRCAEFVAAAEDEEYLDE
jgi:hypothetical protein